MIRVTVELWPFGEEKHKRTLATADIFNDGTGDQRTGNYGFRIFGKSGHAMGTGKIMGFKRLDRHVWDLVMLVLNKARGEHSAEKS